MSTVGAAPTDAFPVSTLTVLSLSLVPCVLVLLLLNCVLLACRLLSVSRAKRPRSRRQDSEEMLLHSCVSTRHRAARITQEPFLLLQSQGTSVSGGPVSLPGPVTSSRTSSSQEKAPTGVPGLRFLRPDGATGTGSGSLTAPSTILADSAAHGCSSTGGRNAHKGRKVDRWRSARLPRQWSDSDADTRSDHAPPNSPQDHPSKVTP